MRKMTVMCAVMFACAAFTHADDVADARAAAEAYVKSVKSGNLNALYQQLPDVWKASMEMIGEAADVAQTKSDLVADLILQSKKIPKADAQASVKNISAALKTFSQKVTVKTLQNGNIAGILADPELAKLGPAIVPFFKDEIDGAAITGAKAGENGIVEILLKNKAGKEDTLKFKKVGQSWVEADMAKDWKEQMANAKKSIGEMKITDESKQKFLQTVPMLKMGMQQLKNAKNAQELQNSAGMMLLPIMMMNGGGDKE